MKWALGLLLLIGGGWIYLNGWLPGSTFSSKSYAFYETSLAQSSDDLIRNIGRFAVPIGAPEVSDHSFEARLWGQSAILLLKEGRGRSVASLAASINDLKTPVQHRLWQEAVQSDMELEFGKPMLLQNVNLSSVSWLNHQSDEQIFLRYQLWPRDINGYQLALFSFHETGKIFPIW